MLMRYIVIDDKRRVRGGIECSPKTARKITSKSEYQHWTLLPAGEGSV